MIATLLSAILIGLVVWLVGTLIGLSAEQTTVKIIAVIVLIALCLALLGHSF